MPKTNEVPQNCYHSPFMVNLYDEATRVCATWQYRSKVFRLVHNFVHFSDKNLIKYNILKHFKGCVAQVQLHEEIHL